MTKLKALLFGPTFALAMTAAPAVHAKQVDLGKHSPAEIKSACAGGSYIRGGGAWSCFKKCDGGTCSVSCDKDGCSGTTPDRAAPVVTGRRGLTDTLSGKIAR